MLWLKARSFLALGITTATRKASPVGACVTAGASVPTWVASEGASVATEVTGTGDAQALNTSANASNGVINHANFFIFFSLIMGLANNSGFQILKSADRK